MLSALTRIPRLNEETYFTAPLFQSSSANYAPLDESRCYCSHLRLSVTLYVSNGLRQKSQLCSLAESSRYTVNNLHFD